MPPRFRHRYEWHGGRLAEPRPGALRLRMDRFPTGLGRAVAAVGVPRTSDAATPLEDLIGLLRAAAEIEHGLMVQYLYAGYSAAAPDVAGTLAEVATDEMGHLMTVQNLLLASGAAPWLGRYDQTAGDFAPFPFTLAPSSIEVIAKFAACERPEDELLSEEESALLPELLAAATRAAQVEPMRVGLLYAKIYWLLRDSDEEDPDEPWLNFPVKEMKAASPGWHVPGWPVTAIAEIQGGHPPWRGTATGMVLRKATTRGEGLAAIADVSAQGEGFANADDAHFDRFRDIFQRGAGEGLPAPRDPWHPDSPKAGNPSSELTNPVAAGLARLGDLAYELVLLLSALALQFPVGTPPAVRIGVGRASIRLMRDVLQAIAQELRTRPRAVGGDPAAECAGLCFSMPEEVPDGAEALRVSSNAALDSASRVIETLRASGLDTAAAVLVDDSESTLAAVRAALAAA